MGGDGAGVVLGFGGGTIILISGGRDGGEDVDVKSGGVAAVIRVVGVVGLVKLDAKCIFVFSYNEIIKSVIFVMI